MRAKVAKKSTLIDMTAMCDVAFLLLTFFILTGQFRPEEPLPVDIPSSTVKIKVPESDYATILVGDGKIYFNVIGQPVRMRMLERMGERYNITFSEEEKQKFSVVSYLGVSIHSMRNYLNIEPNHRSKSGLEQGVPLDSLDNQLSGWIISARYATKEVNGTALRLSIKADKDVEYPLVKEVIETLQEQNVNKFSLITSLEGGEAEE